MTLPGIRAIRRIVTGHDADGQSIILSDGPSAHAIALAGVPTFGVTDIWKTLQSPASNAGGDPCSPDVKLAPPAGGTVFRIVEFPPDSEYLGKWKADDAFGSMGESGSDAIQHAGAARHEAMHTTNSVDYAFVIEGEIWAVLDNAETRMTAGDVLVQRGTSHAWSNRSTRPCIVGFVLIDAMPL